MKGIAQITYAKLCAGYFAHYLILRAILSKGRKSLEGTYFTSVILWGTYLDNFIKMHLVYCLFSVQFVKHTRLNSALIFYLVVVYMQYKKSVHFTTSKQHETNYTDCWFLPEWVKYFRLEVFGCKQQWMMIESWLLIQKVVLLSHSSTSNRWQDACNISKQVIYTCHLPETSRKRKAFSQSYHLI